MGLNNWYDKGLTPDEYIKSLGDLKDGFSNIYKYFKPANENDFFQQVKDMKLRVIVIAEPWCGHCMLNIPIVLRLAQKTDMPVRLLPRDENLELMDQYLTNGKSRTIPIIIFIDYDGNEVAKWGPIAKKTKQFVDKHKKDLPPKDAENYQEKLMEMYKITAKAFSEDSNLWNGTYDSMKQALLDGTN